MPPPNLAVHPPVLLSSCYLKSVVMRPPGLLPFVLQASVAGRSSAVNDILKKSSYFAAVCSATIMKHSWWKEHRELFAKAFCRSVWGPGVGGAAGSAGGGAAAAASRSRSNSYADWNFSAAVAGGSGGVGEGAAASNEGSSRSRLNSVDAAGGGASAATAGVTGPSGASKRKRAIDASTLDLLRKNVSFFVIIDKAIELMSWYDMSDNDIAVEKSELLAEFIAAVQNAASIEELFAKACVSFSIDQIMFE